MRHGLFVGFALVLACAGQQTVAPIALTPQAESVEIAVESPGLDSHVLVGPVEAVAVGHDVEAATLFARNLLRNKAAALGASLVTVDKSSAEVVLLQDMSKVTLEGRAFKPVD